MTKRTCLVQLETHDLFVQTGAAVACSLYSDIVTEYPSIIVCGCMLDAETLGVLQTKRSGMHPSHLTSGQIEWPDHDMARRPNKTEVGGYTETAGLAGHAWDGFDATICDASTLHRG